MDNQLLSSFSHAVRKSTLKRLRQIPPSKENWRLTPNAMSIAEHAKHLIDADNWLFAKLENPGLNSMVGEAYSFSCESREKYEELLDELVYNGKARDALLSSITEAALQEQIYDDRFKGKVSVWWLIMRGNIDHEIHHRGQLAACIRFLTDDKK